MCDLSASSVQGLAGMEWVLLGELGFLGLGLGLRLDSGLDKLGVVLAGCWGIMTIL